MPLWALVFYMQSIFNCCITSTFGIIILLGHELVNVCTFQLCRCKVNFLRLLGNKAVKIVRSIPVDFSSITVSKWFKFTQISFQKIVLQDVCSFSQNFYSSPISSFYLSIFFNYYPWPQWSINRSLGKEIQKRDA